MNERPFVIVTGASRGIGRAIAKALVHEHQCDVLAIARDPEALRSLADGMEDGRLLVLEADITEGTVPARILALMGGRRITALINNAGLLVTRPFGQWTTEDLERLFHTNVFAPIRLVQALKERFTEPGHIVNIGSMGGFQGSTKFPGLLGYSASKAALANVTECLAEELKDTGVRCNCLCIGAVDTGMLRAAFPGFTALVSEERMGAHIARFALEGHNLFNGKVLPVALSTP